MDFWICSATTARAADFELVVPQTAQRLQATQATLAPFCLFCDLLLIKLLTGEGLGA